MDQQVLEELLRTWQQRLRLQDWDVRIAITREREMEGSRQSGEIELLLNHRLAWISLLDPLDIDPKYHADNDPETIIVHELLHLFTESLDLPETGPKSSAAEQMLNALARALVAAYSTGGTA